MAVLDVNQEGLHVRLGPVERVCTRHGDGVHAARDQIAGVSVVTEPWAALFGLRQRGIGLPGLLVLGVWSQPCDGLCCDLVLLHGRPSGTHRAARPLLRPTAGQHRAAQRGGRRSARVTNSKLSSLERGGRFR